jgi:succinoglycan biosynthesis transport protein ExoP
LMDLNDHAVQLDDLERNVQILEGKYRMHVEKLEQARVNDALGRDGISNIKVAQAATLVGKPSSPKKPLMLALGLMLAIGGALTVPFVSEILDDTLRSTDQIEKALGLPVLLSFPYRKRTHQSLNAAKRSDLAGQREPLEGSYQGLVRDLLHNNGCGNGELHSKAIGVVGCGAASARSRVSSEIAMHAASCANERVLLIDADERHRHVAHRFGLNGSPGWREVLAGVAEAENCVHPADGGRLEVMTSGQEQTPATNGAMPPSGAGRLDALKSKYGLVVIDLPSVAEFDTNASAKWLDETVLVVEAERTRIQSAQRAKALLERAGIRVTGVVLANRREHVPKWLYDRL